MSNDSNLTPDPADELPQIGDQQQEQTFFESLKEKGSQAAGKAKEAASSAAGKTKEFSQREGVQKRYKQAKKKWFGLTKKQRWIVGGVAVLFVLGLIITVFEGDNGGGNKGNRGTSGGSSSSSSSTAYRDGYNDGLVGAKNKVSTINSGGRSKQFLIDRMKDEFSKMKKARDGFIDEYGTKADISQRNKGMCDAWADVMKRNGIH